MENLHQEYIYLDGVWLKEEQLILMAKNAGCMTLAEHYLCAYLVNAVLNGNQKAIGTVNEIRRIYNLDAIPETEDSKGGISGKRNKDQTTELAREKYKNMHAEIRKNLLCKSLKNLKSRHQDLFDSQACWNAIFLVVKDRLDNSIKKSHFAKWARTFTPEDWPEDLTISESTLRNFSHYVEYSDREEAYYDMESNPWKVLCDTFWEIVKMTILTSV